VDSIGAKVNSTENMEEFRELTKIRKNLQAIVVVVDFCKKHGYEHADLPSVLSQQDHFLSVDPKAGVVWPPFLIAAGTSHKIRACTTPADFWSAVRSSFSSCTPMEMCDKQASIIAERIVGISKADDLQNRLRDFFHLDVDLKGVSVDLHEQIEDVHVMAWYGQVSAKGLSTLLPILERAVARAENEDLPISSALSVFPGGRAVVGAARVFLSRGRSLLNYLAPALEYVKGLHDDLRNSSAGVRWDTSARLKDLDLRLAVSLRGELLKPGMWSWSRASVFARFAHRFRHGPSYLRYVGKGAGGN